MIVIYAENMLKLESGAIGELVRSTMLMAMVDRLIDLDVSLIELLDELVPEIFLHLYV